LRLEVEPVAAASYFLRVAGHRLGAGEFAVVYDFGAGTFDASVIRRTGDGIEVVAAEGLPDAGGLDIDAAIVARIAQTMDEASQPAWQQLTSPGTAAQRRAGRELWTNVRVAKEMLSRATTTLVHLPVLDRQVPLGREELEELAAPVVARTVLDHRGRGGSRDGRRRPAGGRVPLRRVEPDARGRRGAAPGAGRGTDHGGPARAGGGRGGAADRVVVRTRARGGGAAGRGPSARPAAVPARRSRRRRLAMVAGGVAGGVAGVLVAVLVAVGVLADDGADPAGDGSSPRATVAAPARSPTPSPSPAAAGLDPCLLGRWVSTNSQHINTIDGDPVPFTGGGALLTYRPNGTATLDFNRSKPERATVGGVRWTYQIRGTVTANVHHERGTEYLSNVRPRAPSRSTPMDAGTTASPCDCCSSRSSTCAPPAPSGS
jgi:hypothetical protein